MNVTLTMADVTTCVTIPLGATTAHVDQDTHYKKMASLVWVSTVCSVVCVVKNVLGYCKSIKMDTIQ